MNFLTLCRQERWDECRYVCLERAMSILLLFHFSVVQSKDKTKGEKVLSPEQNTKYDKNLKQRKSSSSRERALINCMIKCMTNTTGKECNERTVCSPPVSFWCRFCLDCFSFCPGLSLFLSLLFVSEWTWTWRWTVSSSPLSVTGLFDVILVRMPSFLLFLLLELPLSFLWFIGRLERLTFTRYTRGTLLSHWLRKKQDKSGQEGNNKRIILIILQVIDDILFLANCLGNLLYVFR